MCGIGGILHGDSGRVADSSMLQVMRDQMAHRGPDGAGMFCDGEVGLVHRRLSIIDLSDRANQPFRSDDGRYTLVYNGELFNYRELRAELLAFGDTFSTESDTEVLLKGYARFGPAILDKLNGMFAFALWDSRERNLFVARDRVGVKPLYYALVNGTFYFASEPKALFAAGVPADINPETRDEWLLFKYVAGERTIFRHVRRLLPGHWMRVANGKLSATRWWNLADRVRLKREALPTDPYAWFEETFYSSVKYRTISDVPVGVMLSGGLDSGSVAAALSRNGERDMSAFTFVFDDASYNEGPLARRVADKFGLRLHEVRLSAEQLRETIREAAWYYDEPMVHQNDAQMLALSRAAKPHVTVLLSGEGGDEFMGGYVRYKPLQHPFLLRLAGQLAPVLRRLPSRGIVNRFDKLSRYTSATDLQHLVMLNATSVYPADLKSYGIPIGLESFEYRQQVYAEARALYPDEPARQAMYMDIFTHMASVLDRNDRMTMGAGIECRVPFMDYRLMEMIPALPTEMLLRGKKGKHLLVQTVAQQLPDEVLAFRKLGFSVPWEQTLASDPYFLDLLHDRRDVSGLTEGLPVDRWMKAFHAGDPLGTALVRQILMMKIWEDAYLKPIQQPDGATA